METKRLILRDIRIDDFKGVHEYASDKDVCRYTTFGPNSEEETIGFIHNAIALNNTEPRREYTMVVIEKNLHKIIGGCSLTIHDMYNQEAEFGYVFHKEFWNKGYATEVARLLLEVGFNELGMHRLMATCDPENSASRHILEKLGLNFEGTMKENFRKKNGHWRDSAIYGILENEYNKVKKDY